MNFFFGYKDQNYFSKITISKFQNSGKTNKQLNIFSAKIKNNFWIIDKLLAKEDDYFYYLDINEVDSHSIFFLATINEVNKLQDGNCSELVNLNHFTDTTPEYRSNFKIFNLNGGYSSYQSDYPYKMINKKGNILSSVFVLTNQNADKNYVLIRNIYYKPVIEDFKIYIVNIKTKKIIFDKDIKTNFTNLVELKKEHLGKDCYLFSKKYLGIPIFLIVEKDHMSLEHTLPPHSYIISSNKFERVSEIKEKINEIIN